MLTRKETRKIFVGDIAVGGHAPIVVQSMTNTDTRDSDSTVKQINHLERLGCEIIRVAVPDQVAGDCIKKIKGRIGIPLIADIHNDYRLAIMSFEQGADCIRINPGNIGGVNKTREVIKTAKKFNASIRIGVNSGSLQKKILQKYGHPTPEALVESALEYLKIFEDEGFRDLKVSLKSSSVLNTISSYKKFSAECDYPLHLGVTEAGLPIEAAVKSSLGIGSLLMDGVGDTFRVSVTGNPVEEMRIAYDILRSLEIRKRGVNLIACPTCGRTEIDLISLAEKAHEKLKHIEKSLTVAVMGCPVNGPGEAKEADIGIAGGKNGKWVLFKKGEIIEKGRGEEEALKRLVEEIQSWRI
jgi:(E)-4-hydroxy-3-methylbut-2-enyl-diphosphate synthase